MSAKVEEDGYMRPCDIERAARMWEQKGKEIQPWDDEVAYCVGRAAGLREALRILAREE